MTGSVLLTVPLAVPGDKTVYPTLAISSTNPDVRTGDIRNANENNKIGGWGAYNGTKGFLGPLETFQKSVEKMAWAGQPRTSVAAGRC